MRELEHEIARLELQAEQLAIHIKHLPPGSAEAIAVRADLDTVVHRLEFVKRERDQLLSELEEAA